MKVFEIVVQHEHRLLPLRCVSASSRRPLLALLATSYFVAALASPPNTTLDPITVYQAITRVGGAAEIASLTANGDQWREFLASVASGEQSWVNLGVLLLPSTHGESRTALRLALEDAVVASPAVTVGSVSKGSPTFAMVCGASAHAKYDLAAESDDQRLSAVLGALMVQNTNSLAESIRKRLNSCADTLEAAAKRLRGGTR